MDISEREPIEWLNYWIEDANEYRRRIILIGDSVTRDLRKKLNFYLGEGYCVDLLAMSYSILDDMVLEEIKHFFKRTPYQYDFIIYHLGAHHGYGIECIKSERAVSQYTDRVREILVELKKFSDNIGVMTLTLEGCADEESGLNHNKEIKKRNKILKAVSKELDLLFYDLNQEIDYKIMRYIDRCHFTDDDYEYMSERIIGYFFPEIHFVYANRIREMENLREKLDAYANVYVYGNGVRGKSLKIYLQKYGYAFREFIVSDKYAHLYNNVVKTDQAEKENALVIVTPTDIEVWKKLEREGFDYITLGANIYTHINDEISGMNLM